jgi:hypothetical protein
LALFWGLYFTSSSSESESAIKLLITSKEEIVLGLPSEVLIISKLSVPSVLAYLGSSGFSGAPSTSSQSDQSSSSGMVPAFAASAAHKASLALSASMASAFLGIFRYYSASE